MFFLDRNDAGKKLAKKLLKTFPELVGSRDTLVLALPRGGVPVAFEVAKQFAAPLNLILTHKLSAPDNPELAIGAVAEDGSYFFDPHFTYVVSKKYLYEEIARQLKEIHKRIKKYRSGKPLTNLTKKCLILVDDGIATGATMRAAIKLAKTKSASRVIVATPVIPPDTLATLKEEAEICFLQAPEPFLAIGRFYNHFDQLSDIDVASYLIEAKEMLKNKFSKRNFCILCENREE